MVTNNLVSISYLMFVLDVVYVAVVFIVLFPKRMKKCTVLQTHAADTEFSFEFLILATAHCTLPPEPHAPPAPSSLYQIALTNY